MWSPVCFSPILPETDVVHAAAQSHVSVRSDVEDWNEGLKCEYKKHK